MAEDVREEAERLVAAALAAASYALRGAGKDSPLAELAERFLGGGPAGDAEESGWGHFATGTPECCVCPVCRAISALRDPNPEFAARLAMGASDLFAGVTTILRALQGATARPAPPPKARTGDGRATWRAATHDDDDEWLEPEPDESASGADAWHAATRAPARPTPPPDEPA